jgi:hypothetical protein
VQSVFPLPSSLQPLVADHTLVVHCEEGCRLHQPAGCGKVVSTKVGCGRFDSKNSGAAPGLLAKRRVHGGAIPDIDHDSRLTRRSIIGAAAALICMPAIVRVTNLMPGAFASFAKTQYAGFVERPYLHALEISLQAGARASRNSIEVGSHKIRVESARRSVTFAQAQGWLLPYIGAATAQFAEAVIPNCADPPYIAV